MSRMGVPSIRSAPETSSTQPSSGSLRMPSSRTQDRPMGLGRKGERVANTPMRVLPPSRGGRTVGDQSERRLPENCQISQMWEKSSRPRRASGLRNSGSNTIRAFSASTSPLWRGMANLVGKSLWMRAITRMGTSPAMARVSSPFSARWGRMRGSSSGRSSLTGLRRILAELYHNFYRKKSRASRPGPPSSKNGTRSH